MGTKKRPKKPNYDYDSDSYDSFDDYEEEFGEDLGNIRKLSKDFYSTEWEDPSEYGNRFSTRRKIERRNDLRNLYSQLDDGDDLDFGNEW